MCSQLHVEYLYSNSWDYSHKLKRSLTNIDLSLLAWKNEKIFMSSMLQDINHECDYVDQRVSKLFESLKDITINTPLYEMMVDNIHLLISSKTMKMLVFKEMYLVYLEAQKITKLDESIQEVEQICLDIKNLL